MSSRHLHPVSCRLPRAETERVVAIAFQRKMSISGLIKEALRAHLAGVDSGVHENVTAVEAGASLFVIPKADPVNRATTVAARSGPADGFSD